ncbi:GntR family transcriptional regulator [Streptomyces sp. Y7]|uniref:GntR family transcriptional regulator n=1 Tax=Streptomyces sp. Y7 TaxID=3342392 RepID=UPI00371A10C0
MSDRAVRVDTTSQVPPYEQIRAQLAALIRTGRLTEGERLPTVRQLAADLGLAPGTVARAYRELEAAELIRTRRGAGTRVAGLPSGPHAHDAHRLGTLARDFTSAARALGAGTEDILAAVRDALNSDSGHAAATDDSAAADPRTTEATVTGR